MLHRLAGGKSFSLRELFVRDLLEVILLNRSVLRPTQYKVQYEEEGGQMVATGLWLTGGAKFYSFCSIHFIQLCNISLQNSDISLFNFINGERVH